MARLKQYDVGYHLPKFVQSSLDDGFAFASKGLLGWMPIPNPAQNPLGRMLILALEATLTFAFWAMEAKPEDCAMDHLCPWDRNTLEYDGLCSHCALAERIVGNFDMSPEEAEAMAEEKEKRRIALKAQNGSNWHYKKMVEDYDNYIGQSSERVARSRANNPGRDAKIQANRVTKALAEKTWHCERCNLSFGTKQILQNHEKTPKHIRKLSQKSNPFVCLPCDLGFHNKSNLTRHEGSDRHRLALERLESEREAPGTDSPADSPAN